MNRNRLHVITNNQYALERAVILLSTCLYLIVFNVTIPHGDALRISSQVEAGHVSANPNHLLLDLFGLVWHECLQLVGLNVDVLTGFESISAIATLASLFLFHVILVSAGIRSRSARLMLVAALFASKNFLSMAVSQYFFMLQMPFLLGALWNSLQMSKLREIRAPYGRYVDGTAICLAIAACIEINNVIPIIFVGIAIALKDSRSRSWQLLATLRFWTVAAVIGFPIYIAAYIWTDPDVNFLSWALSYAGESGSSVDDFYGTKLSLSELISSAATVAFHFGFGNFVETAGMGTVLKVLFFGQPLEFIPNKLKFVFAATLMPVVGVGVALLIIKSLIRSKADFFVRFILAWILAYLCFNLYWPYSGDLFWFQLLPLMWVLFSILFFKVRKEAHGSAPRFGMTQTRSTLVLGIFALSMLALNTFQTVMPISRKDIDEHRGQHQALIREGDLEVITGWDRYKWMMSDHSDPAKDRLLLMNMTFLNDDDPAHISKLPEIVDRHLETGGRVIVARLYALDRESNPWYGLATNGWPRKRIQELLSDFCVRPLATIDDVGFHQLSRCTNIRMGD